MCVCFISSLLVLYKWFTFAIFEFYWVSMIVERDTLKKKELTLLIKLCIILFRFRTNFNAIQYYNSISSHRSSKKLGKKNWNKNECMVQFRWVSEWSETRIKKVFALNIHLKYLKWEKKKIKRTKNPEKSNAAVGKWVLWSIFWKKKPPKPSFRP